VGNNESHHAQTYEPKECERQRKIPSLFSIVNESGTDLMINLFSIDLVQERMNLFIAKPKGLREEGVSGRQLKQKTISTKEYDTLRP